MEVTQVAAIVGGILWTIATGVGLAVSLTLVVYFIRNWEVR